MKFRKGDLVTLSPKAPQYISVGKGKRSDYLGAVGEITSDVTNESFAQIWWPSLFIHAKWALFYIIHFKDFKSLKEK